MMTIMALLTFKMYGVPGTMSLSFWYDNFKNLSLALSIPKYATCHRVFEMDWSYSKQLLFFSLFQRVLGFGSFFKFGFR